MTNLSVNVNKVATLRNTRHLEIPSVVHIARLSLEAGAQGITIHPRPDGRHIRPHDVYQIAELLGSFPEAEFNIEGNPFHVYLGYARELRPAQCTLVPDEPDAATSNQGWDLVRDGERLRPIITELKDLGCRVSLFMDAGTPHLELARAIGADRIELYTEPYAAAFARTDPDAATAFAATAAEAGRLGLGVNAGHDLNRDNLPSFLSTVPDVLEVSIGHALIADALEFGIAGTVERYLAAIAMGNALGSSAI
ncbi:MAG TPA: pyridoxine 5'-phosphate synthase [Candidatus Kapabacteria bacterium]|nr:pyridoxine 5'-phosphate synthase [Candidatus Kapabacteria bacterium]